MINKQQRARYLKHRLDLDRFECMACGLTVKCGDALDCLAPSAEPLEWEPVVAGMSVKITCPQCGYHFVELFGLDELFLPSD